VTGNPARNVLSSVYLIQLKGNQRETHVSDIKHTEKHDCEGKSMIFIIVFVKIKFIALVRLFTPV
jgi:hypothetical protein